MSYQVLARKWRPRIFTELVGQEHVVKALVNALDNDRLHHAFLFTGTRGVGKTTISRIFAKSLNCEEGVSSTPCGVCSACREIDEGRFVDLIEVDAASRTKVDDTRELLENVQYAPTRGKYKVYLIDEVHMLSISSFNALLKTLEEPPPHVKFLLATTDPQKVPPTVLSRCLQFHLKRMPAELISGQMEKLLGAEGISFDSGAVTRLARAADGSMRDGLSLLDQAIAFGGGELGEAGVRDMLGDLDRSQLYGALSALRDGDGQAMLALVAEMAEQAPEWSEALKELTAILHRIALEQVVPGSADAGLDGNEQVAELAASLPAEDIQLYYQIAIAGQRDLPLAADPRSGFEMVLLRMLAFRPGDAAPVAAAPASRPAAAPSRPSTPAQPAPSANPAPAAGSPASAGVAEARRALRQSLGGEVAPRSNNPVDAVRESLRAGRGGGARPPAEPEPEPEPAASAPAPEPEPLPPAAEPVAAVPVEPTPPPTAEPPPWDMPEAPAPAPSAEATPRVANEPAPALSAEPLVDEANASDEPVDLAKMALSSARDLLKNGKKPKPRPAPEPMPEPEPVMQSTAAAADEAVWVESLESDDEAETPAAGGTLDPASWAQTVEQLDVAGMARELASNAELIAHAGNVVQLAMKKAQERLRNPRAEERLRQALGAWLGDEIRLEIELRDSTAETPTEMARRLEAQHREQARQSIDADPAVQALIARFGAEVVANSVRPLDDAPKSE